MRNSQRILAISGVLAVLGLLWAAGPAWSQSEEPASCPQIVQLALDNSEQFCAALGDDEACYGHVRVEAVPQDGVEAFKFAEEGDIEALINVKSIRLSPMDLINGSWGVALMRMRAYMQYSEPEPVTFLLFGDVDVENGGTRVAFMDVTTVAATNVRLRPSANAGVIGVLPAGTTTEANGRLEDSSWLRVVLPESGRVGWAYAPNLTSEEAIEDLNIVDAQASYFGPMQAFFVRSGVDDAACPESPQSGLLIQTPEGVAEVSLLVNEVSIALRATAYMQADPGGDMTIGVLDGYGWVEAGGQRQPIFAGTQVRVPLGEDLISSGVPSQPEPYSLSTLAALPLSLLGTPVTVADPLSADRIASLLNQVATSGGTLAEVLNGTAFTADDSSTTADGGTTSELPPGLEGAAPPGQGGTNPGDGGTPPGQIKK